MVFSTLPLSAQDPRHSKVRNHTFFDLFSTPLLTASMSRYPHGTPQFLPCRRLRGQEGTCWSETPPLFFLCEWTLLAMRSEGSVRCIPRVQDGTRRNLGSVHLPPHPLTKKIPFFHKKKGIFFTLVVTAHAKKNTTHQYLFMLSMRRRSSLHSN